jgi:alpha-beta hydrolase superfamily lysophospholipase
MSQVSSTAVEERRLKTSDGIDLGAWLSPRAGNRPTLLLLHGNGAARSSFAKLIPFLEREGFGVLVISMRAHGDSTGDVNDFGYSARHDVTAAISFLEQERPGRPIVIIGESLGAAAALFAAKDCVGRVKGYLFAAPYDGLDTAVWNRCNRYLFPPLTQAAYAGLLLWSPVFLPVSFKRVRPGEHLPDIPETVPVTFFASEDDRYARISEVTSMAEAIQSHARIISVRGGGHGQFLSIHEAEYRQAILDLVAQVDRSN